MTGFSMYMYIVWDSRCVPLSEVSSFQGVLNNGFHYALYMDITQVLFDPDGCLKKYTTVMEILQEFYEV